jgi:hypothetical protein
MDALQKNIAITRGEAQGAALLASLAIQSSLFVVANRKEVLVGMMAFVDDSLNRSGPSKGDSDDAFNTLVRETARNVAMQHLDQITRNLEEVPGRA